MEAVMVRTQIQMKEEQMKHLKELALDKDVSVAELIRRAVQEYIAGSNKPDREIIKKRALAAIGKYSSKEKDLARNHDKYLAEDFS
jgi:hypothetical protein